MNIKRMYMVLFTLTALFLVQNIVFADAVTPAQSDKLVARYQFNADAKDSSGNGNDGTIIGDVTFENDHLFGKVASFNGGYIEVKSAPGLDLYGKFTVSAWVRVDNSMSSPNSKNGSLMSKLDNNGNYNNYHLYTSGAYGVRMDAYGTSILSGNPQLNLNGRWSNIVITSDGNSLYMYYDGVLRATKSITGRKAAASSNIMRIGTGNDINNSTLMFAGRMAEMRIYNVALSAGEIKADYNSIATPKPSEINKLVAQYKLYNSSNDTTSAGNNGTIIGDVSFESDSLFGKAAVFNGGYIEVPSAPELTPGSVFTFSAWVKVDPAMYTPINKNGPVFSKLDATGNYKVYDFFTTGRYTSTFYSKYTKSGEVSAYMTGAFQTLNLSSWANLVVTSDGRNIYSYCNGVLKSTKAITGGADDYIRTSDYPLRIGMGNDANHSNMLFYGRMADLRMYNYSLSAAQIKSLYADVKIAVASTSPANNAAGVALNKVIKVTFNQNVLKGTAFNSIRVAKGGSNVAVSSKWISGKSIYIKLSKNMSKGTKYTITMPAKAVKNANGYSLSTKYTFSFTTKR